MATELEKQLSYEDYVKQVADTLMVGHGFTPVSMPSRSNEDTIVYGYKCDKKDCKSPYEFIIVSGLEELENSGRLEELFKVRCTIRINEHDCNSTKELAS